MDTSRLTLAAVTVCALALACACAGCAEPPTGAVAPRETVATSVPAPAAWDLGTPESAVRSYLDWVSFSYRMVNSDIATPTMTPDESVHVDSYIELNRQGNKGLEQTLTLFDVRSRSESATSTLLAAHEEWRYRYFSLDPLEYSSPWYTASYDSTYTVVRSPLGWVVAAVDVTELTPIK